MVESLYLIDKQTLGDRRVKEWIWEKSGEIEEIKTAEEVEGAGLPHCGY